MTNAQGICFVSYKRTHIEETELLITALRNRGIPTWRDVDDLVSTPTEVELRAILADPATASAVMLITPDVAESAMIGLTEAPEIFRRVRKKDGFFVQPVLVGAGYGQVDEILRHPADFQSLANWNLAKAPSAPLSAQDARTVACRVLAERISALQNSGSYDVGIYSRRIADGSGLDLRHDFSPYFDGRKPQPNAYREIETAFLDTATLLLKAHRNPTLNAEGVASLPLGILFGAVFSPLAGFTLNWKQTFRGVSDANWSLSALEAGYGVKAERTLGSLESQDIVLALGVNADI